MKIIKEIISKITKSGKIIAPASSEQGEWKAFFDISEDGGNTWTRTDFVVAKDNRGKTVGMIQPTLWEDEKGLHMLIRTNMGHIYKSDSTDGGKTWSEPQVYSPYRGRTYDAFFPLLAVAAIYLVMVIFFTKLVNILERRLRKSER